MSAAIRRALLFLVWSWSISTSCSVFAQDPFAEEEAVETADAGAADTSDEAEDDQASTDDAISDEAEAGDAPAAPSGTSRATRRRAELATEQAAQEAQSQSAAVRNILASNPQSALERLRAIDQLLRLDEPTHAQPLWKALVAMSLDDRTKVSLHEQLGTPVFLRIARSPGLDPAPDVVVSDWLRIVRESLESPARIAAAIEQLESAERVAQHRAAQRLLNAGPSAVGPLVTHLAEHPQTPIRPILAEILQRLGRSALDPLACYTDCRDEKLRTAAWWAIGHTRDARGRVTLARPAWGVNVSSSERKVAEQAWQRLGAGDAANLARELLQREADRVSRGWNEGDSSEMTRVQGWVWNAENQLPERVEMTTRDAMALTAARHLHDLAILEPQNARWSTAEGVARLEALQGIAGWDHPLTTMPASPQPAFETPAVRLQSILAAALVDRHDGAAIAAAHLLAKHLDIHREELRFDTPSPWFSAFEHANPRVRFAAAQALAAHAAGRSFSGAGRWLEQVAYFSASQGEAVALVAHPRLAVAQHWAGQLTSVGYRGVGVHTLAEMWAAATESPDIEVLFLSDAMHEETLWSILQAWQAHPRTSRIPVIVLARESRIDADEQVLSSFARVDLVPEEMTADGLASVVTRIRELTPRDQVPAELRLERAQQALGWLAHTAAKGAPETPSLDETQTLEILDRALSNPQAVSTAIDKLTTLASPAAQRTLMAAANREDLSWATRRAVVEGLRQSLERHGLRLRPVDIERQYARYNASQRADQQTQELLGGILDLLEPKLKIEHAPREPRS